MKLIKANESNASRRRIYFHLVDGEDGITPETGEAAGQPQVSVDGSAWTDTGISTLTAIGHGRYHAELAQTLIAAAGLTIETRYKSANTAECPGDTVQVVAFDPHDASALGLSRIDADITSRAAPGDEMDFIDAPNEAAVDVIQAGLATGSDIAGVAAAVWSESTRTLTAFSFLTAGGIAGAVWDEALASHDTTGSAGAQLANASASGDPLASAVPGSYETGTAGDALARVYDIRSIVQAGAGHE